MDTSANDAPKRTLAAARAAPADEDAVVVGVGERELQLWSGSQQCSFRLGARLGAVLRTLRQTRWAWLGRGAFTYSDVNPFQAHLVLEYRACGVTLYFSSLTQQLLFFDVDPNGTTRTRYREVALYLPERTIGFAVIQDALQNARVAHNASMFALLTTGLQVFFSIPSALRMRPELQHDSALLARELVKDARLVPSRFRVLPAEATVESLDNTPADVFSDADQLGLDMVFGEPERVTVTMPPFCAVPTVELPDKRLLGRRVIRIGDTCQHVLHVLGMPSKHYLKRPRPWQTVSTADYFFNYFEQGLDVMFSGRTHRVLQVVLHTNMPGHVDFAVYEKCHFALRLPSNDVWAQLVGRIPVKAQTAAASGVVVGDLLGATDIAGPTHAGAGFAGRQEVEPGSEVVVSDAMTWEEIQGHLGKVRLEERRRSDAWLHGAGGAGGFDVGDQPVISSHETNRNPFGETRYHGHGCAIFEVMQNEHIASVTVFDPDQPPSGGLGGAED